VAVGLQRHESVLGSDGPGRRAGAEPRGLRQGRQIAESAGPDRRNRGIQRTHAHRQIDGGSTVEDPTDSGPHLVLSSLGQGSPFTGPGETPRPLHPGWLTTGALALVTTFGLTMAVRWIGVYRPVQLRSSAPANPAASAATPGSREAWTASQSGPMGTPGRPGRRTIPGELAVPPERHSRLRCHSPRHLRCRHDRSRRADHSKGRVAPSEWRNEGRAVRGVAQLVQPRSRSTRGLQPPLPRN
jgi:hypothetical protein